MSNGYVGDFLRGPRPVRRPREGDGVREPIRWLRNRCEVCQREWRDVVERVRCNQHPASLYTPAVCECGAPYFRRCSPETAGVYSRCPDCRTYPRTAGHPRVVSLSGARRGSSWYLWRDVELSFDDIVRAWEDRFDGMDNEE